jgi:hypothetical protein
LQGERGRVEKGWEIDWGGKERKEGLRGVRRREEKG